MIHSKLIIEVIGLEKSIKKINFIFLPTNSLKLDQIILSFSVIPREVWMGINTQ
jgi:hypothetical protein